MNIRQNKTEANKNQSVSFDAAPTHSGATTAQVLADNRPEAAEQKQVQLAVNNSKKNEHITQLKAKADKKSTQPSTYKIKQNNTGLPDGLKSGIEQLSGYSMDDVKVHYNSDAPAQLQAHAYAQGTDIHLGPGQTRHLPHEAWHVVQQKQGRVHPTKQMKGQVGVNDAAGLEQEADQMGAMAQQMAEDSSDKTTGLSENKKLKKGASGATVQRVPYALLNDAQKEVVDAHSNQLFEQGAARFEQHIGHMAASDSRSHHAANELVDRTALLIETLYFNTKQEADATLEKAYGKAFGIEGRKDITGGVGSNVEFIKEVMSGGSFREQMTLFYVSMAERQTLNKMILDYKVQVDKEIELFGNSGDIEERRYLDKMLELQGLGESMEVTGAGRKKKEGYVGEKRKKEFFKRAFKWVLLEIKLERNAHERGVPNANVKRSPEETILQKEQDEELAGVIVDTVNNGVLTGDEISNKDKQQRYRNSVELFFRIGMVIKNAQDPSDTTAKDQFNSIDAYKTKSIQEMDQKQARYDAGFGWLKVLIDPIFADFEEQVKETIQELAGQKDVDAEDLTNRIKLNIVEDVFDNDLGGSMFDQQSSKKMEDSFLNDLLRTKMESKVKNFENIAQGLKQENDNAEKGVASDNTAEQLAESRFHLESALFGPSLFWLKGGVEESRKGGARVMAPPSQQTSDTTPAMLEKDEHSRLSYRELAHTFYSPSEFQEALLDFKKRNSIGLDTTLNQEQTGELRSEMYEKNKNEKLPWKPGMKYWKLDVKSPLVEVANLLKVPVGAAVSGSTDRVLRGAMVLGLKDSQLEKVLLACLGWMIPAHDHTFYEIMKAAEPYVKTAPAKQPFQELVVDPNYAYGMGYLKAVKFFPSIKKEDLPQYYLSTEFKDTIADKMFPEQAEKDDTLKILSNKDGVIVYTGTPMQYSTREPEEAGVRYEWYWLRQETNEARGNFATAEKEFATTWDYQGIYKIYCLVYPLEGANKDLPVASLRYDQTVFKAESESQSGETESSEPGEVGAKAVFSELTGGTQVVPLKINYDIGDATIRCTLNAPDSLSVENTTFSDYQGTASQPKKNRSGSEISGMYNKIVRKDKDIRAIKAEAMWDALVKWGEEQKYDTTGSVNIDIYDSQTKVILKEYFFYIDRGLEKMDSEAILPAYRTQGGDFKSGIKSSVRLVNTREGGLDISGDAMVWVNFADKSRLVWWLNNRTDRSYSVAFQVKSKLLQDITGNMVEEHESNAKDTVTKQPINKGKAIISQDKATHQYAISKATTEHGEYANLDKLKAAALGQVIKLFQWKTFDLKDAGSRSLVPEGAGILATPFNEALKEAKELEIKIRLLEKAGAPIEDITPLRQQQKEKEAQGRKDWDRDYHFNLRKPGERNVSKEDRRTPGEIEESVLFEQRWKLIASIKKIIDPILGPVLAGPIIQLKLDLPQKEGEERVAEIKKRVGAAAGIKAAYIKVKAKAKETIDLENVLPGLPEQFKKDLFSLAANQNIQGYLMKNKFYTGLNKKDQDAVKAALFFTLKTKGFGDEAVEKPEEDATASTTPATKQKGQVTSVGSTSSKSSGKVKFDLSTLKADDFEYTATELATGGMANAVNTCYLATVMQLVAVSTSYANLFLQTDTDGMEAERAVVITLGRRIVQAIRSGERVEAESMRAFRQALIHNGWMFGSRDSEASQQDAAMMLRWLLEDFFKAGAGILETHSHQRPGFSAGESQRTERVIQLGGLQSAAVNAGRSLTSLLTEMYTQRQVEKENNGVDTLHDYRIAALPEELTVQVMRYDFSQVLQEYSIRKELIQIENELEFIGPLSPEVGQKYVYELDGFNMHVGLSPKGGHYTAYVKRGGNWFYTSDSTVRQVELAEVNEAKLKGYLYHYTKIRKEATIEVPTVMDHDAWEASRAIVDTAEQTTYKRMLSLVLNPQELFDYCCLLTTERNQFWVQKFNEYSSAYSTTQKEQGSAILKALQNAQLYWVLMPIAIMQNFNNDDNLRAIFGAMGEDKRLSLTTRIEGGLEPMEENAHKERWRAILALVQEEY